MASMTEQTCGCGKKFMARTADVKRGWGKSCSKSCAATKSNKETGKYRKLMHREYNEFSNGDPIEDTFHPHDPYALGQE